MSESYEFIVHEVLPLTYNTKLLLGVHDNVGLFAMWEHDEVIANKIRKGCTIVATEAVLEGEPEATYLNKATGRKTAYLNPQQKVAIGGNIKIVAPVPQESNLVSKRNYTEATPVATQ